MIVIAQRTGRIDDIDKLNTEVYDLLLTKANYAFAEFQKCQAK